jgi:tetratricopeptide (TPR) repeat protein
LDYQTATSLVQRRQFEEALSLLQRILDRSPQDLKARNLMGITLSATGRRAEANDQFKKVLAVDANFVPALKNLAVNELALGLVQDARPHFEAALKLAPRDVTCHWGLAEIAFAARDFQNAAVHYEQSGDLALKDPRVTIRFAASYIEIKQAGKAAVLLEKIPLDQDANVQFQVGILLAKMEQYGAAARRFEMARQGFPDPYQVEYNLALVLIKKGDYAAAIRTGEEMLKAGHRKAEVYNLLAQAYSQAGQTKQAYDALRAATELEPLDETNYLDLILLCVERRNYELGLEITDIGLRRIPSSHRLHLQRGVILAMKSRYEEAEKEFQTSAQLAPEAGLAYVAWGLVLLQMEKVSDAVNVLRLQSKRNPNDPYVLWFLAEALNRFGAKPGSEPEKEAINALEKAIRLDPRLPQARALLGKMLLRRGEVNRAVEELEKALELDPENLAATYQLAQALQRKGQKARARQLFDQVEKVKREKPQSTERDLLRIIKAGST